MRSDKQIQASTENGKHSKGPATPEGKARAAQNAITHGLSARAVVLTNESTERFEAVLQSLCNRFQPNDEAEYLCVEEMAWAKWRLRRAVGFETSLLESEVATTEAPNQSTRNAKAFVKLNREDPGFRNLARYEAAHRRAYSRAFQELRILKNEKFQNQPTNPVHPEIGTGFSLYQTPNRSQTPTQAQKAQTESENQ